MVDFGKALKGERQMPRAKADDPFDDDWGMPDGGESAASDEMPDAPATDRLDYLKPHHLGKQTTGTMELIGVTGLTTEYSDVVFHVKVGGKDFHLGMKFFSKDYVALKKRFGNKKSDWKGQLRFKVMPHKGNPRGYVAVR
jgi:hypothetical protein